MLEILYRDEFLIAINKPPGLMVHKSKMAKDVKVFALQLLRDQIAQHVFPVHRIDRKTSGILLFALNKEVERDMQMQFMQQEVEKHYLAILRGYAPLQGEIDYALLNDKEVLQASVTRFETLEHAEQQVQNGIFPTARYSLVVAKPLTGRMHQLRRHFSHIFHPIIGDRTHGCNKQNKLVKENFQLDEMYLHASYLKFYHPITQELIEIKAALSSAFMLALKQLNFKYAQQSIDNTVI